MLKETARALLPSEPEGKGTSAGPELTARSKRTRARILAAARKVFATRGLGGANMEGIAAAARINKRMVYQHFGTKEALFLAVLEEAYGEMRTAEQLLHLEQTEPVDGFRRLIAFTWNYLLAHPDFLVLVNSENLYRARHIKKSKRFEVLSTHLISMIEHLLERGERSGVFRKGIDPAQLWVSICGLSWFYISNTHTISVTFGRNMLSTRERQYRLSHMTDLVLSYVLALR